MIQKVFTPEKVYELAEFIYQKATFNNYVEKTAASITEWLEQNPIEPVVIRISDEQCDKFGEIFCEEEGCDWAGEYLKNHLQTQTFTQLEDIAELQEEIADLKKENYHLDDSLNFLIKVRDKLQDEVNLLKLQLFEPNWDDAPKDCNFRAQNANSGWVYFEKEPSPNQKYWTAPHDCWIPIVNENWKDTLQQRPKQPTAIVEVG
jgi:FtsZ-binding cell division protein ZapB